MATYKHLRSSTANKRPTTTIVDGQLAINTNTASPGLFFKDSAGTGIVKVGPVHVGTTAPNSVPASGGSTGNYTGEQWLDTSVSPAQMKIWNGSTWVGVVADELPVSKLQDGAARQLIQTDAAGTGVEWTNSIDLPGTLDVTGASTLDSTLSVAGVATFAAGSAGSPSLTFTGDANTGVYTPGADQVSVATGGTERLRIDSTGQIEAVSLGTAAAPTYSWTGDPNTGIYSPGADQVAISTGGTERLAVDSSGNVVIGNNANYRGKDNTGTARNLLRIDSSNNTVIGTAASSNRVFIEGVGSGEAARIDSSGRLLVGTTTSFGDAAIVQSIGTNAYTFQGFRFGGDNGLISLGSAAGTQASPSILTTGNLNLGGIVFRSYDSAAYRIGAQITAVAESEWASADCPTRLVFSTTADGASSPTERMRISNAGTTTLTSAVSTAPFIANIGAIEVARLDTNGRLLLGVSTGIVTSGGFTPGIQVAANASAAMSAGRYSNTTSGPSVVMQKSRNATLGAHTIVNSNDILGNLTFEGSDGSAFIGAAAIIAQADGTPGVDDMPGRLGFFTRPAGAANSLTERFRITNDGVIVHDQPAPAAVNATATLTVANLKTGIITSTSAVATDMTLPTGTDTQAGFAGTFDNFTFEWSVINTGPSLVRVLAGTAHTIVGSGSVATGTSGRFASRRTAANTFVTYRLS